MTRNLPRTPSPPGGPSPSVDSEAPRRKVFRQQGFLALLLIAGAVATATADETVLDIRSQLTVSESDVRLQDIVINPAGLPEGWKNRVVIPSPAPGAPHHYTLFMLACGLQLYEDMSAVRLRGATSVTIDRPGVALEMGLLTVAVETFVKNHERWKGSDPIVRLDPLSRPITVPTNARPPVVRTFEPTADPNRYRFDLAVDAGSREALSVPVTVEVRLATQIWVAAQDLARGHLLCAVDLSTESLPTTKAVRFMTVGSSVVGLELIRPLRAGQRLESHSIAPPVCVRQGEQLVVAVQQGSLRILMQAKALASGRKDERIFCLNESSGTRLSVRLTGAHEALVDR